MKTLLTLIIIFSLSGFGILLSQSEDLPKYMTAQEEEIWDSYLDSLRKSRQTGELPEKSVRVMGEWEEIQALFLSWRSYPVVLTEIVRHAVEEVKVYIITQNEGNVRTTLTNAGIPLDNVEFVNWPTNTVWIRDYGPWAVYENDVEQLAISDYIYNRPRPLDNAIPERVAEHFGLPYYSATQVPYDLVHTGGNNLVDGYQTGYSSRIVSRENPGKTDMEIDYITNRLFGYDEYVKMTELPFDGISHLDMHMRFIDEETVIIGEYPEGVADGPQIEQNIEHFLNNHETAFGNPYAVKRIPMPPGFNGNYPDQGGPYRTFTNSIFLNGTILVPIYEEQYDTVGLRIYRENLPGYKVVGIDCNEMINSLGALHCITKTVGVDDPLWIAHPRIRDVYDETHSPEVRALAKHKNGIQELELYYKTASDADYQVLVMDQDPEEPHWYSAQIPSMEFGTEIQYYISAMSNSGKSQSRPLVAPEGYFSYRVIEPDLAPESAFSSNLIQICPGGSVRFLDRSDHGISEREWFFPGGTPAQSIAQNPEVLYEQAGTFDVVLITHNVIGSDTLFMENYIEVELGNQPFVEEFRQGLDTLIWDNFDNSNNTFKWSSFEGTSCYDNTSIRLDNYNVDNRGVESTIQGHFDLSQMVQPQLYFSVAYAPFSAEFFDGLEVEIVNCEGEVEVVFKEFGPELSTAPPTGEMVFVPASCDEWEDHVLDLSEFAGENVYLKFKNLGGWGNMLYLDNIFIKDAGSENQPPMVQFLNPSEDLELAADFPVELEVELQAYDNDGFIADLVVELDGLVVGNFDVKPYQLPLTFQQEGEYQLTAVATDNDGRESDAVLRKIIIGEPSSVSTDLGSEVEWSLSPNPTSGKFRLNLKNDLPCSDSYFNITDVVGRDMGESFPVESTEMEVDVSHLPSGIYRFSLVMCNQQTVQNLLIID